MATTTTGLAFLRGVARAERAGDHIWLVVDVDDVRAGSVPDELARVQPKAARMSDHGP